MHPLRCKGCLTSTNVRWIGHHVKDALHRESRRCRSLGSLSVSGTAGDGILILAAGVVGALTGLVLVNSAKPALGLLMLLAGAVATGVGWLDLQNAMERVKTVAVESELVRASVGPGLYLVLVGGIVMIGSGLLALRSR